MYIRLRPNKSGSSTVYLLDSIRVDGKKYSSSKVVKCFGSSADQAQLDKWIAEAEVLKSNLNKHNITFRNFTNIKQDSDISSCVVEELGMRYVYKRIFHSLFAKLSIKNIDKELLSDLVTMRIAMPVSKLKTANIAHCFGIKGLTINKIYKMMDSLSDTKIEAIKKHIFENTKALLGNKIRVMFYDLTTIYFEVNSETELKAFGFSKDGKSQHVQISLALIVTDHGMPIGYEIFKGNIFEGSTLIPSLEKLRQDYRVEDVTIVADSAMLSKSNIDALIAHNFKFIVSARIRNMSAKLTNEMLDNKDYIDTDNMRFKVIKLDGDKKLIVIFSEKRKNKDEHDRYKALESLKKLEGKVSKSGLRGSLKKSYIKINKDSIIELDEKKIEESKKLDGYYGFISNSKMSSEEIIWQYKGLWQVEQSFRITKHNLKIRPVYHYVDRRIRAHFAICYMSLALVRNLEYKLKLAGSYIAIEELHSYLEEIKEVKLTVNGSESAIVTDIPNKLMSVFMALNISLPKRYHVKRRV